MTDSGDCYKAAAIYITDNRLMGRDVSELTLVHGLPTLQCAPFEKFGHAWIECEVPGGEVLVKELANGANLLIPASLYYKAGNINPAECDRYSYIDIRHWVTQTGHWGPWDKSS